MLSNPAPRDELLLTVVAPGQPDWEQVMRDFIAGPDEIRDLETKLATAREKFRVARTIVETQVRNTAAAACGRVK